MDRQELADRLDNLLGWISSLQRRYRIGESDIADLRAAASIIRGDEGSKPVVGVGLDEDLGSSSIESAPGDRASDALPAGQYRCTRCGQNEITARRDGCKRGPCPMEYVGVVA